MGVFIGDIVKILPEIYEMHSLIESVYPVDKVGKRTNRLMHKLVENVGIKYKPMVLDIEKIPEKKLKRKEYHPLNWGKAIINYLSKKIGKENIGFLSVSYNISFNDNYLPNLASQLVIETGLEVDFIPEELPYYGCASGVFSLKNAIDYCNRYNRAAIVYVFDQCSKVAYFSYNQEDPYFKKTLKSNFLFSDGAVGLLIIPEKLKHKLTGPMIEVLDIQLDFVPGNSIRMEEGKFLIDTELKEKIPPIVSKKVIKPVLDRNNLNLEMIDEWAIHQGGFAILKKFTDKNILGLAKEQILPSWELLEKYGNLSSPSCFLVLEQFFKNRNKKAGTYGIITGFGAGYYMGSVLYKWA